MTRSLILLGFLCCYVVGWVSCFGPPPQKLPQPNLIREISVTKCETISRKWKTKDFYSNVISCLNYLYDHDHLPKEFSYFGWFENNSDLNCGPNCVLWIERVNSYELKVKKVWYPRFFKTNITGSIVTLAQETGCIIDFSELKIFEIDTWTAMVHTVQKIKRKILLGNNTDVFAL